MRKAMFAAVLGLGLMGFTLPGQAKASWLSEGLDHTQVNVNFGPQYAPAYPAVPAYPAYRPAYTPPAYSYYPSYAPAYRPAPVYQPQRSFYGPSRYEQPRRERHDGRSEWRR
jgi:hypothetical protein